MPRTHNTTPTRFVLVTPPRCGSTYLATLLNSHPEILCHGELFYEKAIYYAVGYRDGVLNLASIEERDRDPDLLLRRVWDHPFGNRAVGFKLVAGQHAGAFRHVFGDRGIRKLILYRRNRLKKFVSNCIAELEGNWTNYKHRFRPEDLPPVRICVDIEQFRAYLAKEDAFYNQIEGEYGLGDHPHMRVFYEDLFRAGSVSNILEFLDVTRDDSSLEAATIKRNSKNLRDLIENFDELAVALGDTEFANELHDTGY